MSATTLRRLALLAAVLVTLTLFWWLPTPLGVPDEWIWNRIPFASETPLTAAVTLVIGALYLALVVTGRRRLDAATGLERSGWCIALVVAAFGWLTAIQECVPAPSNLAKVPWVLYYPRSSGYFWQARYDIDSTTDFLADYEAQLAQRDYLHLGTHPPGLTLAYRGLLSACRSSDRLTAALLATLPPSARESCDILREASARGRAGQPVTDADLATLWLAALLTLGAAALTTLALYLLARRHSRASCAWELAALWPLVPALAVFHPKSDVLLTLPAVGTAWLWLSGEDRHSPGRCCLAGLLAWLGMMVSLAFLVVLLIIVLTTLFESCLSPSVGVTGHRTLRARSTRLAAALAGFGLPTLLLAGLWRCNLLNVWWWNLQNHALFYDHNPRTWGAWLLVNPLELAFAVGLPIAGAAGLGVVQVLRHRNWRDPATSGTWAALLVWGILWISGKNMGEAARLWILLMPWVVLSVGLLRRTSLPATTPDTTPSAAGSWIELVGAQLLVGLLTVTRVDGFHFGELEHPVQPARYELPAGRPVSHSDAEGTADLPSRRSGPRVA